MTIPANPASFIDWDDTDVVEGEGFSRQDMEQLLSNQRYLNQQLAVTGGPWPTSSDDFWEHFTRPEDTIFGADTEGGVKLRSPDNLTVNQGNNGVVVLQGNAFDNEGFASHSVRQIPSGTFFVEFRIKPGVWAANYNFIFGMSDNTNPSGSPHLSVNGVYLVKGTTTNTWRLLTRMNSATQEDTDDIASGVTWGEWIVVRLTYTITNVVLSMGEDRDSLVDLADHDISLPTAELNLTASTTTTLSSSTEVDYCGLQTIGNPVAA